MKILGISGYYHDSAAALLVDGRLVAAAQEERFSRKKNDARFPAESIRYCLTTAGVRLRDLDAVVFYDKPLPKFERLIETYLTYAPKGLRSFSAAMPLWVKEKLFLKGTLRKELCKLEGLTAKQLPKLLFSEHHESHAASAFFPSPFEDAAVLCLDGVGEWATTSAWQGKGNTLEPLWEIRFPHSVGLLYSAFTYYTGFKVNSGEYKLMGLAPYGTPKYASLIREKLVDIKADGSFRLNMKYFNFATDLTMINHHFCDLFGQPARKSHEPLTQFHMDIASSVQVVTEEIVLALARTLKEETGARFLCLAGGVALNCVANGRLLREGPFEDVWVQPASGDAGGALGAAYAAWHGYFGKPRSAPGADTLSGSYLGPRFSEKEIESFLESVGASYTKLSDDELFDRVASVLAEKAIVGWFRGRMEFGPRALGARSILCDPRGESAQSAMNLKIKYRESFRPFAPAVLNEDAGRYFDIDRPSPYMMFVAPVAEARRRSARDAELFGIERLKVVRSEIPAVTHVDFSARLQTVHRETNPGFHALIETFKRQTGCAVLVNTSFNVRGEPIVCTPEDAYRCFMTTEIDYLVLENFVLKKQDQLRLAKRVVGAGSYDED